jgi:hypothetical protein
VVQSAGNQAATPHAIISPIRIAGSWSLMVDAARDSTSRTARSRSKAPSEALHPSSDRGGDSIK